MCAIVDINIIHELWQDTGNAAGQGFRAAVEQGKVPLVVGGSQYARELNKSNLRIRQWIAELKRAGKLATLDNTAVDVQKESLKQDVDACKSSDHHILALALISKARLLYTNDRNLIKDFGNKELIDSPRGKVYSTARSSDFNRSRKRLLSDQTLCKR